MCHNNNMNKIENKYKLKRKGWGNIHKKVKIKVIRQVEGETDSKVFRKVYMIITGDILRQLEDDIK